MATSIKIGTWHERVSRNVDRHPTSYAADWQTHQTKAGEYPVVLVFETGYLIPMPYWLMVGIGSRVVAGMTFSGFGGVNYSSSAIEPRDEPLVLQMYAYSLPNLVRDGHITVDPAWAWLVTNNLTKAAMERNLTWAGLREMGGVHC